MGVIRREVDFSKFTDSLSSPSKCMEVNYCKYPFIVICVVGGIILLTTIWCLCRCICCGIACCSCCCGGCGGRRKTPKRPPIMISSPSAPVPPGRRMSEEPKYAYYSSDGKSSTDDSLPIMPSFEKTDYVEVSETHEMTPVRSSPPPHQFPPPRQPPIHMHQPSPRHYGPSPTDRFHGTNAPGGLAPPAWQQNRPASNDGSYYDASPSDLGMNVPSHRGNDRTPSPMGEASSYYNEPTDSRRGPSPQQWPSASRPAPKPPVPTLGLPKPRFLGPTGNRNTVQRNYVQSIQNPFQYDPRHDNHTTPGPKHEEWSVI